MFPMVAEAWEFEEARALLKLELDRAAQAAQQVPSEIKIGAMIEVPSLYFQLDTLLDRLDFVSVGSNDLKQFLYAADRGNPRLADRYDSLAPAMIKLLGMIADAANARGTSLSLCGEMAGDPIAAMALLCLGFRQLSMAPTSIGPVRAMIRSLDLGRLRSYWAELQVRPVSDLRSRLLVFARDHGVAL
jgi:phosphotransferase system enzyme I (PtsP)